jgi:hypothetical protein
MRDAETAWAALSSVAPAERAALMRAYARTLPADELGRLREYSAAAARVAVITRLVNLRASGWHG